MNKLFSFSDLEYSRIKLSVIKRGSTTTPTARSESAKPQSKTIDGTRSVGVFQTACNTSKFPTIDDMARGMFTAQLKTRTFFMASVMFPPNGGGLFQCFFERHVSVQVKVQTISLKSRLQTSGKKKTVGIYSNYQKFENNRLKIF